MLTLFIGDNTSKLADYANLKNVSVLATDKNYKQLLEQSKTKNIVAHTSFSDMGKTTKAESPLHTLLMAADSIEYYPPKKWSDHSDVFKWHSMQRITEYFLYDVNLRKKNVTGLSLDHWTTDVKYLRLADTRRTPGQNLWISGCSISNGDGVENHQNYGQLLADSLELPVSFLTKGGTSIEWAADQILRSDIQKNDILVWGLTEEYRATEWDSNNHRIKNISPNKLAASEPGSLPLISEENRLFKALIAVNQVENFCNKIGVKLILFPLLSSETLRLHLSSNQCYIANLYQNGFIDIGDDGIHPGPQQHKIWFEYLKRHI